MTLVKFNPQNTMRNFGFDRFFDSFLNNDWMNDEVSGSWLPVVDISETDNGYHFEAELPGLDKEDVKISMNDQVLTISGEKKYENKDEKANCHRMERRYGKFERKFRINSEVLIDKIDAVFKNGVLSINVPKAEIAKPKNIEVKIK